LGEEAAALLISPLRNNPLTTALSICEFGLWSTSSLLHG
jgi:hypothetical protein